MLNITYKYRKANIWVRERTKVIDIINTVRKLNGPGQGISHASMTTDGPRVSPLGDHMARKDDKGDSQAVERRPGQILERHDVAEESTIQGNLETAC